MIFAIVEGVYTDSSVSLGPDCAHAPAQTSDAASHPRMRAALTIALH
jgi:hypothetical protein